MESFLFELEASRRLIIEPARADAITLALLKPFGYDISFE